MGLEAILSSLIVDRDLLSAPPNSSLFFPSKLKTILVLMANAFGAR
jgi:hypothetical protein